MNDARPVTIHDVAQKAGVAVSSVSRALSDHPDVSDLMRTKVLKAADALGYAPDPVAQSMRSGSTRTIGLVVRDFGNPLFAEIMNGAEQVLTEAGYTLLVMNSGGDEPRELERITLLRRRRVDALLLSTISEDGPALRKAVTGFGKPVVLLDRDLGKSVLSRVVFDHASGVKAATSDLISLGHRRIAMVTGSTDIRPTRERLRGFHEAHADAAREVANDLEVASVFSVGFAQDRTIELMNRPVRRRPTALMSGGIQSTLGVLEGLSELGLRPGSDVALVVCDDLPWLRVLRPAISVVTRDAEGLGRAAAEQALSLVKGGLPRQQVLSTDYAPRETSTKARPRG